MSIEQPQSFSRWSSRKESFLIALFGGVPLSVGQALRRLVYRTLFARVGQGVRIHPRVEFESADRIELGDRVTLNSDVRIRCRGLNSKIRLGERVGLDRGVDIKAHHSADIEIGEYSYIGAYSCLSGDTIKIGRYCLIASHAGIYANNHGFEDTTRWIKEQPSSYKGIVIEDDCWLGCGVKVLDGVTIGRGSVIGAGAVVTKNIPPYSIAVGVPAKVVSKRTGTREKSLEAEVLQGGESLELQAETVAKGTTLDSSNSGVNRTSY